MEPACLIWNEGRCNIDCTEQFLQRIAEWVVAKGRRVVIVWDGAPWHQANRLKQTAAVLNLELLQLP